jgi:Family of unknown function (DUF5681)
MTDNLPKPTRTNRGSWRKGVSGNPGGRPKAIKDLREECQRMTPALLARLRKRAENPKISTTELTRITELIFAYGHGRPATTQVEVKNDVVLVRWLTAEESNDPATAHQIEGSALPRVTWDGGDDA